MIKSIIMRYIKLAGLIAMSFCIVMMGSGCGKIDEPNENNTDYIDYKNDKSLSADEKKLVGYWVGSLTLIIFADHYVLGSGCDKWYYNPENKVFSSRLTTFKIEVLNDDYIFAENMDKRNVYELDKFQFHKKSDEDFMKYFYSYKANTEFFYGVSLTSSYDERIEFDDKYNGVTSDGRKVTIKNPFYLSKSAIIVDGVEYKIKPELLQ